MLFTDNILSLIEISEFVSNTEIYLHREIKTKEYLSIKIYQTMKKLFLSFIYAGLILSVVSCKNEEVNSITGEEAAEIVAMSMADDGMGASSFIYTSVNTSSNANDNGMLKAKAVNVIDKDTTVTYSSNPSAVISYLMTASFSYQFTVDAMNNVTASSLTYSYNGNLDAPRLSSVHTGSGNLDVSSVNTETCTVNGLFKRTSDVETKGVRAKQSTSQTTIDFSNIKVNKSTEEILSGTATVNISGNLSGKGNFEYSGSIVFNGEGMATITINDSSYSVNLQTGDYTAL